MYSDNGIFWRSTQSVYNSVLRPYLPTTRRLVLRNGIPSRKELKLLDFNVEFPEYEEALCSAVRNSVSVGDTVVIIGGGWGVTATISANRVGKSGSVTVFEASNKMVDLARETVEINSVQDIVDVNHSCVESYQEDIIETYGASSAPVISPEELPDCDVLELDCEGAENTILEEMTISPEKIVVEVHDVFDAPEDEIREILTNKGYEVTRRGVEDGEKGVYVLTAERTNEV